MDKLLYLIGPFGCVVGMLICMALMRRGMARGHTPTDHGADTSEVAALRAEVAELRAQQSASVDG